MARTHVILSDDVLKAIDALVGERGRSRFLQEAAEEKLQRLRLGQALRRSAGIVKAEDYPHWRDRQTTARWVRETRGTEA